MGIKNDDLFPNNPAYPDALNMVRKDLVVIGMAATRAMTTATKIGVLSADSTMLGLRFYPTTAPNNVTTATLTITATFLATNTTVTLGTVNLLTTTNSANVEGANYFNLERAPAATTSGDILIKATYAETGTASTTGGPFYLTMTFVR